MQIKVLGTGCSKSISLEKAVKEAVAKSGKSVEIENIDDIMQIMAHQVLNTPGLVINGKVVSSGKVLTVDEVIDFINR